jgi:demethylmenaquinone methyltransferase/2-methoxy-6-polyprenyl-1,4-benzoquinol methylase
MLATDSKLPTSGGAEKRSYVRDVFSTIAPHYDLLNHLLSFNIDRRWRRQAVARMGWERFPHGTYLDLCAGTLDLAAMLAGQPGFSGRVLGADFVVPMLQMGRRKHERVRPIAADALQLPFADAAFHGCCIGFGVRNFADLDAGLAETLRVLQPGARLVILEFTTPPRQPLRSIYLFYLLRLLPLIGRLVSKHRDAYSYLPASVLAFPDPDKLANQLERLGCREVDYSLLLGGIAAIHVGTKA